MHHYWIAQGLGFYDDENLDVEIINNVEGGVIETAIELDRLDFGGVGSDTIVLLGSAGELPYKIFYQDLSWDASVWVLDDSSYQTGRDLVGKKVGVTEAKDLPFAELMLAGAGLEKGEYELVITGGRAPAAVAMDRGDTEAFVGSRTDGWAMNTADYPVRALPMDTFTDFPNGGLAATNETLENNRDVAVRFGRAIAKAQVWAQTNPESAVEILQDVAPEGLQDPETFIELLRLTLDGNKALFEARGAGDPAAWQRYVDLAASLEVIPESYDPKDLFTNDLIDEIWDFDVAALVAAAEKDERPTN